MFARFGVLSKLGFILILLQLALALSSCYYSEKKVKEIIEVKNIEKIFKGRVNAISYSSKYHALYIATPKGLYKYEVTSSGEVKVIKKGNFVSVKAKDDGSIIALTDRAVWVYTPLGQWRGYDCPVGKDADILGREIWIASSSGLIRIGPNRTVRYTPKNSILKSEHINYLKEKNGEMWVATALGLYSFKGITERGWYGDLITAEGGKLVQKRGNVDMPHSFVSKFSFNKDGSMWLATGCGALLFKNGKIVKSYTGDYKEASVWAGKLSYRNVEGNSPLPTGWTTDVASDDAGRVWIGTSKGLCMFDGKKWVKRFDRIRERIIDIEVASSNEVYVATRSGVYKVKYYKKEIEKKTTCRMKFGFGRK